MRSAVFIFIFILLCASRLSPSTSLKGTVVWNVGQGQWVSFIRQDRCYHFDAGGEFFPWKKIKSACGARENIFFLSHWDWDHIGALAKPAFHRALKNSCLWEPPLGKSSVTKKRLLEKLAPCPRFKSDHSSWRPRSFKKTNDASRVYFMDRILMPGDSPMTQEKLWKDQAWITPTRVLILGHHGSNTSTSTDLLAQMPQLKISVSSARWRRYFHPHPQTQVRLRHQKVPLLRTEDWGNIWLE